MHVLTLYTVVMFESSMMMTITDYAMKSDKRHGKCMLQQAYNHVTQHVPTEHEPAMWDDLDAKFLKHIDQAEADLKAAGLPALKK